MCIKISKGNTWPDSWKKRLKYNNYIGFTFRNEQLWECSANFEGNKSFSIKLIGFAEMRPFSWKRIKYGGFSEFLNFTHEDSDRIICHYNGGDKVGISTYSYRKGLGPATNSQKAREQFQISQKLGTVSTGETFRVKLNVQDDKTVFELHKVDSDDETSNEFELVKKVETKRDSKSLARFWTYSHAAGHHGSTALDNVKLTIRKIRE